MAIQINLECARKVQANWNADQHPNPIIWLFTILLLFYTSYYLCLPYNRAYNFRFVYIIYFYFMFICLIIQERCDKTVISSSEVNDAHSLVITWYETSNNNNT